MQVRSLSGHQLKQWAIEWLNAEFTILAKHYPYLFLNETSHSTGASESKFIGQD